ncbi:MAG TPA: sulfatase-like hydrolase/transferase [Pseudomonadales bacterium]|nr:sulfatase-like hydrolase/transferase [Pseudomonadales bacterium]
MKRHCFYIKLSLWLSLRAMLFLIPVVLPAQLAQAEELKPNILLIVADDLGLGDLHSFTSSAVTQTPHIDALAAQGMRFSRFYTDSTCSASRAALLTGQHPARLGFHPIARGISPEIITLPDWLHEQGYSTHHIGKWHVGELNAAAKPLAQGFDTSFGFLNQWFLRGPDANGQPVLRQPVYQDPWLDNGSGEWRQYQGYLPDILTQYAAKKIAALADAQQPWFMWYATPLAHGPVHSPPELSGDKNNEDEQYRAMVNHLDRNVGELLESLEKSGQRDNTIIIFLSDNGAPEKRPGSNAGFGGGKAHYSEGAVRTPMIWVDSGRILPDSLDERAVYIADIFPALAARIGKPLPFVTDGVDFFNLDNIPVVNRRAMYWMSRGSSSVLSSDKLWRTVDEWMFRKPSSFTLLHIDNDAVDDRTVWRYGYFRLIAAMQKNFLLWLESVSRTEIKQGTPVAGNDFLRTPLREWDFYLALESREKTAGVQMLAEQRGIWSMTYHAQQQLLSISMHGHQWDVPFVMPTGCVLIGLNADIYDRYTNVGDKVNPTELLLSVNGKEVARTEWQIDSLADVKIDEPTWLGLSAAGDKDWQGKISQPVFYHRANKVGEWPFFIDEDSLQQELCSKLH